VDRDREGTRLEDIGFYTLSDARAASASASSPLWRCEMILTDLCNLRCRYCRGLCPELRGDMPADQAMRTLDLWIAEGLRNVRFSGGEPTLHPALGELVDRCREGGVERIAVSTNGTAKIDAYHRLVDRGVNDLSVSLDGGCCAVGDRMAGRAGAWAKAVRTIREMSRRTYVTVGMVFTEDNVGGCEEAVRFASGLGAADIRVIPAAQYSKALASLDGLPPAVLARHPILRYRVRNAATGRPVRGLGPANCRRCRLALDDMAVAGRWHFPCIIHLREGGGPIGEVGPGMREERAKWVEAHDSLTDPICRNNCLDVCADYNDRAGASADGRQLEGG